ncbi:phosphotransferase [Roseomonas elaeocarpi]|uniref:Hydroxylysine kinase n=1 Tax=Roseomonas elaeocarpi TaxID=907779 RepID=A0ABV6JVP0_9PROT
MPDAEAAAPPATDLLTDRLMLAPPPAVETAPLLAVLRRHWGLDGILTPLSGERDRNFRLLPPAGAPLLVKLAHPDEDPAITDFQNAALLHLEQAAPDLPLPRLLRPRDGGTTLPHPATDGRPCLLRVLSFLPGQPMTAALETAQARALGTLAARLDHGLAGFRHPADRRRLLWDLREAPGLRDLLPEVTEPALRDLAAAAVERFSTLGAPALRALPAQVIHNDLNPHNILVAEDDPARLAGIIDFGDMVRAPPIQEVATACAYLVRPGAAPLRGPAAFLAGYRAVRPVPEEEAALLPVLIATRMAMTVLIAHWRAARQPENAPYILRNMPGARTGLAALADLATPFLPVES